MKVIPRTRIPLHLLSNVYLWFIIVIHNPSTTQRNTKTHVLRFVLARFKVDVVGDGFVHFTTIPVLYTKYQVLDILGDDGVPKWSTCHVEVELVKDTIPIFLLLFPKGILHLVLHSVVNDVFQFL